MSRACRIEGERCAAALSNGGRCTLSGRRIMLADGSEIYLCGNHDGAARARFDGYAERMREVSR